MTWLRAAGTSLVAFLLLSTGFLKALLYQKRNLGLALSLPQGTSIRPAESRRIRHYFYGVCYLNVVFCTLSGKRRSALEKEQV